MNGSVDLDISGMTCASCAARIQKKINQVPGVAGAVNYATHSARVQLDGPGSTADVIAVIDSLGYSARVHADEFAHPAAPAATDDQAEPDDQEEPDAAIHQHPSQAADLRRRLLVAAPLAVAVMVLAMAPGLHGRPEVAWLAVLVSAPVVWWSGWPIHRSNIRGLRHRSLGMDTLVSTGSAVAWVWSLYQAAVSGAEVYAEVAAVVVTFVLLGRWLEARATDTSVDAVAALSRLQVDRVTLVDASGREREVPLSQVSVGDTFVVRPGERVATDGTVATGVTAVDLSLVTGESVPVEVGEGAEVVGGSVNGSGRITVVATAVGSDTVLARIAALVKQAQTGKAPIERLVDRVASVFVPAVIALALATLVGWLIMGAEASFAIGAAVAVLVIACPCALGLATPTALVAGTGRGAQMGVLIRGPQVLEAARAVDTVVLDKTGTVTTGALSIVSVTGGSAEQRRSIAALEAYSEHPIGRAIAEGLADGAPLPDVSGFAAQPGWGAAGEVAGRAVRVGRIEPSVRLPDDLAAAVAAAEADGLTAVLADIDGQPVAVVVVGDSVKPTSRHAVAQLEVMGLAPVLLTGDRRTTADAVAAQAGIGRVVADVAPAQKVAAIRELQSGGRTVAMVGDGINDAAALAQADLGIAMGTGTDAAREAADITVVNSELDSVAAAIALARRTWRTIKQNLVWAFGYNVAAIPLAMSGRLSPMIASAAMAASSVLVVGNSLRLRGFRRG